MTLKFRVEGLIRRSPEEVFYFMKNMYRLPWQTNKAVSAYDKTTPGIVAEGTEFSERVRLSRTREMAVTSRVPEDVKSFQMTEAPGSRTLFIF